MNIQIPGVRQPPAFHVQIISVIFLNLPQGVRTELFPGVTIGWSLSLRLLLSDGANDNLKPVYMPGYGDASSKTSLGASYFISISIPYRTKRVIIKPKVETETDEESDESDSETNTETNSGTNSTSAKKPKKHG